MNTELSKKNRAILLIGPTASGKTACSLALAKTLPIEIISVDSALVYRDMNIGTAKPDVTEQAVCPHHLLDIITPEDSYSAARFRTDALNLIQQIHQRGKLPVLVGGTMLYFKALREGLSDLPQANETLRAQIDEEAARLDWPAMHAELARLDPDAASRLKPNDAQRIQRALEIVRLTGRPLAESYAQKTIRQDAEPEYLSIALHPADRAHLHDNIALRFDKMLQSGFEDEVRQLRQKYSLNLDMPSMRCVGYRQMWEYLDGDVSHDDMRFKGIAATRQLAKRQLTWLRQFREQWPGLINIDSQKSDAPQALITACQQWLDT